MEQRTGSSSEHSHCPAANGAPHQEAVTGFNRIGSQSGNTWESTVTGRRNRSSSVQRKVRHLVRQAATQTQRAAQRICKISFFLQLFL